MAHERIKIKDLIKLLEDVSSVPGAPSEIVPSMMLKSLVIQLNRYRAKKAKIEKIIGDDKMSVTERTARLVEIINED